MIQIFDFGQFNEIIRRCYGDVKGTKRVNVEEYRDYYFFYITVPDDFEYAYVIKKEKLSEAARMNILNGKERKAKYISDTDLKERMIRNAKSSTPS